MSLAKSRAGKPRNKAAFPAVRLFRSASLRHEHACEQVAAVCYRVRDQQIDFLLVQTRGRRWTFPKGNVEAGLTCAQIAALEAFEEAGVHGSVEVAPFAHYTYRKRGVPKNSGGFAVQAHLCHVLQLRRPQEPNRNPKWFSTDRAKARLQQERRLDDSAELVRVVDRALVRIERLLRAGNSAGDALQRVKFDAFEVAGVHGPAQQASAGRYIRREGKGVAPSAPPPAGLLRGKIAAPRGNKAEVIAIDDGRSASRRTKPGRK